MGVWDIYGIKIFVLECRKHVLRCWKNLSTLHCQRILDELPTTT